MSTHEEQAQQEELNKLIERARKLGDFDQSWQAKLALTNDSSETDSKLKAVRGWIELQEELKDLIATAQEDGALDVATHVYGRNASNVKMVSDDSAPIQLRILAVNEMIKNERILRCSVKGTCFTLEQDNDARKVYRSRVHENGMVLPFLIQALHIAYQYVLDKQKMEATHLENDEGFGGPTKRAKLDASE